MASVYKQFLASPSSSYLADRASLHYVTTTTSVYGSTEIIKHLNTLQKQVKIKKQDLLNLVDGQSVIAAEFDTVLEFQTSGGAYLPGLDDNFLSDRVAYLSIVSADSIPLSRAPLGTRSMPLTTCCTDSHCDF